MMKRARSVYLPLGDPHSPKKVKKSSGSILKVAISLILAVMFLSVGVVQGFTGKSNVKADDGFDATRWVMCYFGKDSVPGMMYQYSQTSDIEFELQSKSSIGSGMDSVATGPVLMNSILSIAGSDFQETNETILGRPLQKSGMVTEPGEPPVDSDFNGGVSVNPYDRFGVAGMKFTGYSGEWKYIVVDACNPKDATDPKAGLYYEDRLTPRSVWEDRGDSLDTRTQQHNRGLGLSIITSIMNLFSNTVFGIAKFIVVITLALINFAFTDLVTLMGLNDMIGGKDGNSGIFGLLYEGIFMPLIVMVFVLTGMNLLYQALVKRQYRNALGGVIRSIILFALAIIIAANPLPFIKLPNNVAIVVQSLLVSTMNQGLVGGDGICATGKVVTETDLITDTSADEQGILEQASKNMRSSIGCSFWSQFLLKPWSQGQYGVDWNQTWAKGKTADWADKDTAGEFDNNDDNAKMVGDAAVPMGGGVVLNNWALFQISTQTDAHSPYGKDGEFSKYTSGMANDWWRIVDVMSNYNEMIVEMPVLAGTSSGLEPTAPSEATGSIAEGKLGWPVTTRQTSSPFGNRIHPIKKTKSFHTGLDMPAPCGAVVLAAGDGVVSYAQYNSAYGNRVEVTHANGLLTTYSHMPSLQVSKGQQVTEGQTIGAIGTTGLSTGCHMHFEVKQNGSYVNPQSWLDGSGSTTPTGGNEVGTVLVKHSVPMSPEEAPINTSWDTWVGNSMGGRMAAALSAVLVASIGVVAPLFFAFMSAIYSIGVSLLMAFAPIMFLLGCWSSKGWEIFKGWGELVINATLARIITGLLLVMAVVFSATAIRFMESESWWQGILLMVLLSVILIRARHKIIDMFAAVRFASTNFAGTSKRLSQKITGGATSTAKVAGLAGIGAVSAKASGGSFAKGAAAASRSELRNIAYKNQVVRDGLRSYDTMNQQLGKSGDFGDLGKQHCYRCSEILDEYGEVFFDPVGNIICYACGTDMGPDADLRIGTIKSNEMQGYEQEPEKPYVVDSSYNSDVQTIVGSKQFDSEAKKEEFVEETSAIANDIHEYSKAKRHGYTTVPPPPPEEIVEYLDMNKLREAWDSDAFIYIKNVYAIAWTTWGVEQFSKEFETTVNDILKGINDRESLISTNFESDDETNDETDNNNE